MEINEELRRKIGVALNEAIIGGVEFDRENNTIGCTFSVIAIDENGNAPKENWLLFVFKPVGRFVASYRLGRWDDNDAKVKKFAPENILEIIDGFKGQAIYGWDFVNCGDKDFDTWKDRLSFDFSTGKDIGVTNTIDLFQEGIEDEHIDFRIWFDDFEIFTSKYEKVELDEFLDNGKRGWDAVYENNDKAEKFGIIPITKENMQKIKDSVSKMTDEGELSDFDSK